MMYILTAVALALAVVAMVADFFIGSWLALKVRKLEKEREWHENNMNWCQGEIEKLRSQILNLNFDLPEPDPCENCPLGETNDCQLCALCP